MAYNMTMAGVASTCKMQSIKLQRLEGDVAEQSIILGQWLAHAQKRWKAGECGETTWEDWWIENTVFKGDRKISRLIKIGNAADPRVEFETQRATSKANAARTAARNQAGRIALDTGALDNEPIANDGDLLLKVWNKTSGEGRRYMMRQAGLIFQNDKAKRAA